MALNKAAWRRHLQRSAVTATTPLDQLPPPHYGPGHNLPPPGSDLDTALRRDVNGYGVDFVNQPRVDIDPNIGLSLMMGLTDTLTVRQLLTSKEMSERGLALDKIDDQPPVRNVITHMDKARAEGKSHLVVMLRFPGVHRHGRHYNPTLSNIDPNMIEMPVIIDVRKSALGEGVEDEWRADKLSYTAEDIIGKSAGDKVAQAYGFATAQDMQNSRPLGLNNNWLYRDRHNGSGDAKAIKTLQRSLGKIEHKLTKQHELREGFLNKLTALANDGPDEDMLAAAAQVDALRKEAQPILEQMAPLEQQEQELHAQLKILDNEDDKKPVYADIKTIRQQLHPLHLALQPINAQINRALRKTAPVLEQKWQGQLATRDDEIARLKQLKEQGETELALLENKESPNHTYLPSDHTPVLITMKVAAANPRDYKRVQNDESNEPLPGKPKAVQEIYRRTIFPYALDNRPNGWLKDALGTTDDGIISNKPDYKPDNSYIRATRRYFTHLFEQANASGKNYKNFSDFAEDPSSVLGEAIDTLNKAATSDPALAASWRDKTQGPREGRQVA